jgi:hypothetical protein
VGQIALRGDGFRGYGDIERHDGFSDVDRIKPIPEKLDRRLEFRLHGCMAGDLVLLLVMA